MLPDPRMEAVATEKGARSALLQEVMVEVLQAHRKTKGSVEVMLRSAAKAVTAICLVEMSLSALWPGGDYGTARAMDSALPRAGRRGSILPLAVAAAAG